MYDMLGGTRHTPHTASDTEKSKPDIADSNEKVIAVLPPPLWFTEPPLRDKFGGGLRDTAKWPSN